jgi:hypothetical protein
MGSAVNQRQGAMCGIAAVVLLVVGNFIYGQPPKFAASAEKVTAFYQDHHRAMLIGMILTGVAIPLYVWFLAHLVLAIRGSFGVAVALGGLLVAAAATTGDVLTATATHAAKAGGDPQTIRFAFEASSIAYGRLLWGAVAVAVPLALAVRAGALRSWLAPVLYIQAALMLLGGLSLKSSGFFSPTGGMAVIAFLAYFLGTLAIAVALLQTPPATDQ